MRRIVSLAMAALLLAVCLPLNALAEQDTGFSDVSPDDWYAAAVSDVKDRDLMNGTGSGQFTPDGTLTRAMVVTVLWRLAGRPMYKTPIPFSDVTSVQWYSYAVGWANEHRVTKGVGDNLFGPDEPVTREQMAVLFYRWAQGQLYDVSYPAGGLANPHTASEWAAEAVNWAADRMFLTPRSYATPHGDIVSRILPRQTATRAEVAVFLSRFCQEYLDEAGGPAPTFPYAWDILTMDLPASWQGCYKDSPDIRYDGVPAGRSVMFWDLTNTMARSSHGLLFTLTLWPVGVDSSRFGSWETLGDFGLNRSGRICTVEVPGEGQLALYVDYPRAEDGPRYDPENPQNYVNMSEAIDGILHTIRFREDVEILYLAPALSASLTNKTTLPDQIAHVHQWAGAWSRDETYHWHECTAPDCDITENREKDGYGEHQGDWTVVTEPTDRTAGKRYRTCTVCGGFQQEVTPAPLPTDDEKVLDLRTGAISLTGDDIAALENSLRAIPGVEFQEMNLMGPLIGWYVDLDGDGTEDIDLTLVYKQTGPDEAPNQVEAIRCAARAESSLSSFAYAVPKDRVDACLEMGLPVFGAVRIELHPET